MNPLPGYQGRLAERRGVSEREQRRFRWIGNARLATGIAGVAMAFFVFGETVISAGWLLIPAAVFASLVVYHSRVVERWERANRAVLFYERGVARLEDRWMGVGETGERFRNPAHVYEEDLDLFGKGSLFELVSTARTRAGEDTLAQWFLAPATIQQAAARQQSVQALCPRLDLREDLAVIGEGVRSNLDSESVAAWGEAPAVSFSTGARLAAMVFSAAVVVTFSLYMAGVWTRTPLLLALFVELGCWLWLGARASQVTAAVNAPARDLAVLSRLLQRLESEVFDDPVLAGIQQRLTSGGLVASAEISLAAAPGYDARLAAQPAVCAHRLGRPMEPATGDSHRTLARALGPAHPRMDRGRWGIRSLMLAGRLQLRASRRRVPGISQNARWLL